MSGLGEWGARDPADGSGPVRSAVAIALAGIDADALARDAVRGAMRKRLDAIAAIAVEELLTDPTLDELREAANQAARDALFTPPSSDEPAEPALYYPTLMAFVTEYLTPLYRRSVTGQGMTWCAQWWKHAEAIMRLEALWRSWEYLRQDPHTGISVWLRDHADHHMAVLLSADGPFKGCKPDKHGDRLQKLPTDEPPDGRAMLR
jgi:hypothetical protein